MPEADLLWHWLHADDHRQAFSLTLPFLMAAALGAMLASLVTWMEGHLAIAEQ
jgi:hypothetical protein